MPEDEILAALAEIEAEWANDTPDDETTAVMVEVPILKALIAAYREKK